MCGDWQSLKDNVTQYVDIVVAAPVSTSHWAAIGFSDQGYMVGSTAMIATLPSSGAKVTQYKLESQASPGACVADNSTLSILLGPVVTYDSASSTAYMAFRVDFTNSSAKANWLLWAYGPASADGATIYQHTSRTSTQSAFVTGMVGSPNLQVLFCSHISVFGMSISQPSCKSYLVIHRQAEFRVISCVFKLSWSGKGWLQNPMP